MAHGPQRCTFSSSSTSSRQTSNLLTKTQPQTNQEISAFETARGIGVGLSIRRTKLWSMITVAHGPRSTTGQRHSPARHTLVSCALHALQICLQYGRPVRGPLCSHATFSPSSCATAPPPPGYFLTRMRRYLLWACVSISPHHRSGCDAAPTGTGLHQTWKYADACVCDRHAGRRGHKCASMLDEGAAAVLGKDSTSPRRISFGIIPIFDS